MTTVVPRTKLKLSPKLFFFFYQQQLQVVRPIGVDSFKFPIDKCAVQTCHKEDGSSVDFFFSLISEKKNSLNHTMRGSSD